MIQPIAQAPADYFGARYYASSLDRFMTPDWSDDPEPIPYADLENRSRSISTATSSITR